MSSIPIPISQEAIVDFCQRRGIRRLGLFGSILRDDFTASSDVDVLIEFEQEARITYLDWSTFRTSWLPSSSTRWTSAHTTCSVDISRTR
jgi:predicted nucleotidyltransferase